MLIPIIPPIIVASNAYTIYFIDMSILLYPKAFNVPICTRCSSIILDIDVKLIKAATIKNTAGNTLEILAILSVS